MARITVEDCLKTIKNLNDHSFAQYGRFALILAASRRGKSLGSGEVAMVPIDNDKNSVIALREIAASKIDPRVLIHQLVKSMQLYNKQEKLLEELQQEENEIKEESFSEFDFISDGASYVISNEDLESFEDFENVGDDVDFSDENLSEDDMDLDKR